MTKTTKTKERLLDPEKWYSLTQIVKLGLFSWCTDLRTVRGWIERDRKTKNVLKAVIVGRGRATKYHIKGANIINFIAHVEDGSYRR